MNNWITYIWSCLPFCINFLFIYLFYTYCALDIKVVSTHLLKTSVSWRAERWRSWSSVHVETDKCNGKLSICSRMCGCFPKAISTLVKVNQTPHTHALRPFFSWLATAKVRLQYMCLFSTSFSVQHSSDYPRKPLSFNLRKYSNLTMFNEHSHSISLLSLLLFPLCFFNPTLSAISILQ